LRRAFEPQAEHDELSPAARLAAAAVSGAFAEAKAIKTELLYGVQDVVVPDPQAGEATPVDEVHNPFTEKPDLADRYLRRLGPKDHVEHLLLHQRNARRPRWESYISYATVRAFGAARAEVRRQGGPDVVIFGRADRRERQDQGQAIAECLLSRTPFVLVNPISAPDCYLAVHGETLWASAAIATVGPEDTATAVASGSAVAVTSHGHGVISLSDSPWIPITETGQNPELIRSNLILPGGTASVPSFQFVAPPEMDAVTWLSGNAMILNAFVLGGFGAGFLRSCYPWDAYAVPVAAAAGRTVARVDTQECLGTEALEQLLLDRIVRAERVPGLVIARHEVAAKRLVHRVREYPA
jgi:hypothetical protein